MTSKFELRLSQITVLILSALTFLVQDAAFGQDPAFGQVAAHAHERDLRTRRLLAQNNPEPQIQPGTDDSEALARRRRRRAQAYGRGLSATDGQGFGSGLAGARNPGIPASSTQNDPEMPGARIRRRYGNFGGGAGGDSENPSPGFNNAAGPSHGGGKPGGDSGVDDGASFRRRQWRGDGSETAAGNGGGPSVEGINDMPMRRGRGRFGAAAGGPPGVGPGAGGGPGATFQQSEGRPGYRGGPRGSSSSPFGGKALDLTPLALTDDQKTKVKQMRAQTKLKVKDMHQSVMAKQADLRNLMFSPDATETQIRTARTQLRKLQDQMDETNMNDLLSIRGMLTPEQRKRLPECMPGRNNVGAGLNGGNGAPGGGIIGSSGSGNGTSTGAGTGVGAGLGSAYGGAGGAGTGVGADSEEQRPVRRRRAARRTLEAENDNTTAK